MRIDEELKILAIKTDMTITEMGRRMDKSPQAFSQKIKRGTFTLDDLQEMLWQPEAHWNALLYCRTGNV